MLHRQEALLEVAVLRLRLLGAADEVERRGDDPALLDSERRVRANGEAGRPDHGDRVVCGVAVDEVERFIDY